ncbi:predicted protein [Histoplasma capsulatum var. duboisii H88]|uniref:Predicted protein n=2 Tax=Ajellomyces capsulatus TaxID=5037 RepID=F0UM30_AJEC8|nr:predicted protein [Histoplasma capsulatum H143]EGC48074.1 predicted protein [Histoplasma capsulatum var. duboisii H88]
MRPQGNKGIALPRRQVKGDINFLRIPHCGMIGTSLSTRRPEIQLPNDSATGSDDLSLSWLMREPSTPNLPIYAMAPCSALFWGGLARDIHFWLKSLWQCHAIVKTLTSSFDPSIVASSFQAGRASKQPSASDGVG